VSASAREVPPAMSSPLQDPRLESLLDRLHARSEGQVEELTSYFGRRIRAGEEIDFRHFDDGMHRFFADKLVALDRDKALFCYQMCRALQAVRVVEAGTSFGVSTLYLAAAVRDNQVPAGVVIGTEHEPRKAAIARANFKEAGLAEWIEMREGDLRETLRDPGGPVDFMLIDIWDVALPALQRVSPFLRRGAMVVCDNTAAHPAYYEDYFAFVNDPVQRFRTLTLPFQGGLEVTVRV
jgi:predicted O-methyltransferase YrrM